VINAKGWHSEQLLHPNRKMFKMFPRLRCAIGASTTWMQNADTDKVAEVLNWHVSLFEPIPVSTVALFVHSATSISTRPLDKPSPVASHALTIDYNGVSNPPNALLGNSRVFPPVCHFLHVFDRPYLRPNEDPIVSMQTTFHLASVYSPLSGDSNVKLHFRYHDPLRTKQALMLVSHREL
jgi:hypothetical protein